MKTLKTKILPGFLILAAALPLLLSSCTKDSTDLRDEIVGQYSYTVKIYMDNGSDLVYIGNQADNSDITGTMKVAKNADDSGVLDFFDGTDLMFQGVDIKDTGNAIVFDIPDQEAFIGPTLVMISGYNYWDVESSSYDGAFIYKDTSIEVAFTARIQKVDTGMVMVLTAFRN
jgi:hypothetical protein